MLALRGTSSLGNKGHDTAKGVTMDNHTFWHRITGSATRARAQSQADLRRAALSGVGPVTNPPRHRTPFKLAKIPINIVRVAQTVFLLLNSVQRRCYKVLRGSQPDRLAPNFGIPALRLCVTRATLETMLWKSDVDWRSTLKAPSLFSTVC